MKIALTRQYVDYVLNDCESVFTPRVWDMLCDDESNGTPEWELTDEGYDLADQYRDDASHGYDLCFGRAKGLAQKYTEEQMLVKIVTSAEYVTKPLSKNISLFELIY